MTRLLVSTAVCLLGTAIHGAPDSAPVRPIPPPGIAVPDDERAELTGGLAQFTKEIDELRRELKSAPELLALLPDIEIFHKSVDWALRYDEFFDPKQIVAAKAQLALGLQRAKEMRERKPSWNSATGLVVRGYRSGIDGSIQPYGLVVPDDWEPADQSPRRLDFWLRGRAEKSTELAFIEDRLKNQGEFAPPGAFVVHLYGRYCCANKFAGETDLFEALENVRQHYPIDVDRLVVRGFSMGGASAWQFATHFPGRWAAAAPGAGFAETAEFFKVFAPGKEPPPWWEQVLWRWYDSTIYAGNLAHCPTVAYSGETDGQKQAADIMIRYAAEEGVTIPHIIGPQTAHKYHGESKAKIEAFVTAAVEKGRPRVPDHIRFTTYSLLYPGMNWIKATALERQFERSTIAAETSGEALRIQTTNIAALAVSFPSSSRMAKTPLPTIIDGQNVNVIAGAAQFHKLNGRWQAGGLPPDSRHKQPGVCGPIDHAFMSPFVHVKPTGKPLNDAAGEWARSELDHAVAFWRRVFRGDAPVKDDTGILETDIREANLILWGDPSSNAVLRRMADKLPVKWTAQTLEFNGVKYDAAHHVPILIFPNPLNPQKYVVMNSGVTFREQALLNNSDQTPKLPDWAIIDVRTPADARRPGLIVDAGFFDGQWQLPKPVDQALKK